MPLPIILSATAASISRYISLSFITMTLVVLVALGVKTRWGVTAPVIAGLTGGVLSVHVPALLFVKKHRRQFFPAERVAFLAGTFLAFWFYDGFLRIVDRTLNHGGWSPLQVETAIEAAGVDLVLVWAMVYYSVPFVAWLLFLRRAKSPPNNRWSGP